MNIIGLTIRKVMIINGLTMIIILFINVADTDNIDVNVDSINVDIDYNLEIIDR